MKNNARPIIMLVTILVICALACGAVIAQDNTQGIRFSFGTLYPQSQENRDMIGRGWGIFMEKQITQSTTAPLILCLGYFKHDKTTLMIDTETSEIGNVTTSMMNFPMLLKSTINQGNSYLGLGAGAMYSEVSVNGMGFDNFKISQTKFCFQITSGLKFGSQKNMFIETGYLGSSNIDGYTLTLGASF